MRHLQMCIDSLTGSTQCHVWSFLCISTDINGSTVIFVSYANTCLAVMILQKDNRAGCRAPTTHVSITATVTPPPPFPPPPSLVPVIIPLFRQKIKPQIASLLHLLGSVIQSCLIIFPFSKLLSGNRKQSSACWLSYSDGK